MSKTPTKFFQCFSINLHNFLKSSGLRYMSKNEHRTGLIATKDGEKWNSYPSVYSASKETGVPVKDLKEVLETLNQEEGAPELVHIQQNGETLQFKKRFRVYWVYKVDENLDRALKVWRETGPRAKD